MAWPAKRYSVVAATAALALTCGLGGWAAFAELAGAVIAQGEVRVASNRQVVQHRFGGTVEAIMARDGDIVHAGQILLRLNDARLKAERAILQRRLDNGHARRARLIAERDGAGEISFNADIRARARHDKDLAELLSGQIRLLAARTATHRESRALIDSRIVQIRDEIAGYRNRMEAARRQEEILRPEIETQRSLYERGLVRRARLIELQLESVRLDRDLAAFASEIAGARSRIGENRVALNRLEAERLERIVIELRELDTQTLDLEDELSKIDDELSGIDIVAPVDGIVHASTVHTASAVIRSAEPVLAIVPLAEQLIVEARIEPASIDRIRRDQPAMVRFPAFNARTTPELEGRVRRVSADRMIDQIVGQPYYVVEVTVAADELERLDGRALIPGMPAEVFVRTDTRTPLSYLLKPLSDHLRHALRED